MVESPSASSPRLVTLNLDDLYRQRDEAVELVARLNGAIAVAERMLGIVPGDGAARLPSAATAAKRRPTHRAMLLTVLGEAGGALGVRSMIEAVKVRFDETIPRTSVSPLLRKLASKGEVAHDRDSGSWTLGMVDRASIEKEVRGEVVRFRGPKTAKREMA
jgi:hypothetical protein